MPDQASKKVISRKNIPRKLGIDRLFVVATCLHYWKAPGWVWGIVFTLLGIVFISSIHRMLTDEEVNLFPESEGRVKG